MRKSMRTKPKTAVVSSVAAWILLVTAVSAQGQQASSPTRVAIPTVAPSLPPDVQPNILWQAATQAAQLIDQSQMTVLWQQASAAARLSFAPEGE